jgi:hypothetical protein
MPGQKPGAKTPMVTGRNVAKNYLLTAFGHSP